MKNKLNVHVLIIDPQNDFMDQPDAALPVPGAIEDMKRLSAFINDHGRKISTIHVTLDSHQEVHIAHPIFWVNSKGESPNPFTVISVEDIETGIWTPRNPIHRQHALDYTRELRSKGKYLLMIWPPHCRIGTPGHNVQADLSMALGEWQKLKFANIDFVTKGSNPLVEHYGGLLAEVQDPRDPFTALNSRLLNALAEADIILIAGEALSHCVKETLNQVIDNIGADHVKKIQILRDCTSPIAAVPGGPDFPAIAEDWLKDMQKLGVQITDTKTFFN